MIQHEFKATFERPPEEVFDFLVDFRNEPRWNPDCQSVEKTSEGPIAQGTTFSAKVKKVGWVDSEIVSFQRPTHCATRDKARGMEGGFEFDLQPKDGGTELTARMKMQPRGPMKLLEPVMRPMMKRMLNEVPERMQRGIQSTA
jgi:carbon monoxide dehydrogenase subunit G